MCTQATGCRTVDPPRVSKVGEQKDGPKLVAANPMKSLPIFHTHRLLGSISGSQGHQENKHITKTTENPLCNWLIFEKRFWEDKRDQHNQDEVNEVRGCQVQSDVAPVVKSPVFLAVFQRE